MTYNEEIIRDMFEAIADRTDAGPAGTLVFDSGQTGPTLGITIATHGNEPAGLAVIPFLEKIVLNKGKVIVTINNLEALGQYVSATTLEEKATKRFIDINKNRLPANTLTTTDDTRSEIKRAQTLAPVWDQFDFAIDIHSTTQNSEPMIITIGDTDPFDLLQGMPIKKIIKNLDVISIDQAACHFYRNARSVVIECGGHHEPVSFQRAAKAVETALSNLEMINPADVSSATQEQELYHVYRSIFFPDTTYELTKLFANYEFVSAGTILATGSGPDIIAEEDSHVILAASTKPTFLSEEVCFLTKPVKKNIS